MRRFILKLFRRGKLERDLDSELAFHEEMSRAAGNPIRLGRPARVREEIREVWRWRFLEGFWRDAVHGARQLRKSPGFAAAAVLTLGLALAANAAIFAVVHRVVISPLPYADSNRLIELDHGAALINIPAGIGMKAGLFHYYGDRARTLDGLAIYVSGEATLTGDDEPERIGVTRTTTTLASVLGISPTLGRWFTAEEGLPGAARVAVLSHGFWMRRFGGAADVIGKVLTLEGARTTVIGVMPAAFAFPTPQTNLWLPEPVTRGAPLGIWTHDGVARMREGATIDDVRSELNSLIAEIPEVFAGDPLAPATSTGIGVMSTVRSLKEATVGDIERTLWILLAAVGLVLLVACANVANLFLVRAEARGREVAVRKALGARRSAVVRLFVAESALLSIGGGLVGLALAFAAVRLLVAAAPAGLPRIEEIRPDWAVVAFTFVLCTLAALAFGSIPLWRAGQTAVSLHDGSRRHTPGRDRHRIRHLLMGGQVALALVLLVSSMLMARSFQKLRALDPGFDPDSTLTFRIGLPRRDYPNRESAVTAHLAMLDRLEEIPGVTSVSASTCLPLEGNCFGNGLVVEERGPGVENEGRTTSYRAVAGGWFKTMGIPILRGRGIERVDVDRSEPIAVVDQTFADLIFPGENPLGKRVSWSHPPEPGQPNRFTWLTIVGIVGSTPARTLGETVRAPQIYMPISLTGEYDSRAWEYIGPSAGILSYAVRASVLAPELLPSIRRAIDAVDPGLAIARVGTLEDRLDRATAPMAFTMTLLAIAAAVALMLGLIGIYGVVSYIVSQRTAEIGVRLALGAEPGGVAAMIVRQGGLVALGGIAAGLAGSLALGQLIESLLYGISPHDPFVLVLTTLALFVVAVLACWLPARRAARINPVEALRAD